MTYVVMIIGFLAASWGINNANDYYYGGFATFMVIGGCLAVVLGTLNFALG